VRQLALLLAAGCLAPRNPLPTDVEPAADVVPDPPDIDQIRLACNPREGVWRLYLRTRGWVGQARTWWTVDGHYVETHPLLSQGYDPDGSGEVLFLDLPIAPDVDLADEGVMTAFSCGDDPSIRWSVTPPDAPVYVCVDSEGVFDDWDSVPGLPPCPER
jgi:hypothetical protein